MTTAIQFEVQLLTPDGRLPTRAHHGDVGFDLYASANVRIPVGSVLDVPCGIAIAMPNAMWGLLIGRSSMAHNRRLQVMTSVIDPGYRGEMFIMVHNIGDSPTTIHVGERVAQIVPVVRAMSEHAEAVQVEALSPSPDGRGDGALGSTGL